MTSLYPVELPVNWGATEGSCCPSPPWNKPQTHTVFFAWGVSPSSLDDTSALLEFFVCLYQSSNKNGLLCVCQTREVSSVQSLWQMLTHPFDYHRQYYAIRCSIFLSFSPPHRVHTFLMLLMRNGITKVPMQHLGNHVFSMKQKQLSYLCLTRQHIDM